MNKSFVALMLTLVSLSVTAQSKYNVSGTILDEENSEAVASATVRILSLPDSSMVAGAATGTDGSFVIKDVKKGSYALKITFIGYKDRVMPIELDSQKKKSVDVGYIHIAPDSKLLAEAQVTVNAAQMQVSGDSVVYNAAAFRTAEGSTLEALVKKLPGAKVDADGNITINGKTVKKILVDGKEFFLNDTKVAMENIPTNMIESLKTYDRKSDLSRMTGIDDGEEETVLDLSVKKGMNNGWFGNLNASAGTEHRYDESLFLNHFWENNRITALGGLNNLGRRGFGGGGGRGGGWGGGSGLRTNKNFGLEFAIQASKNLETGGSLRYTYNGSDTRTEASTQSFVTTAGAFSNSKNINLNSSHNWNTQYRFEWKPDSMTTILFRPSGSLSRSYGFSSNMSADFSQDPYNVADDPLDYAITQYDADSLMGIIVNTNMSRGQTFSDSKNASGELQANRRLNNEGRNITLRLTGNISSSESKQLTAAQIRYRGLGTEDDNNRYYTTPGRSRSYSAQFTYSEPIALKTYLQFSYRYNFSYNKNDRQAFVFDPVAYTNLYEALANNRYNISAAIDHMLQNGYQYYGADTDSAANKLTQFSEYKNQDHTIGLSFRKVRDEYNLSFGVELLPQHSVLNYKYMGTEYPTITRNVFNFAPNVDFRYNFDKQTNLRINYRGRTSQPSMTSLLDITDDSNPLYITKGNPGLKPSFSHNVWANFHSFRMEHQRSAFAWASFNTTQNSVSSRTSYDETTGVTTTRPENINGNWNGRIGGGFNTTLDKGNFLYINMYPNVSYTHSVSYLGQAEKARTNTLGIGDNLSFGIHKNWLDISINGSFDYTNSDNSIVTANGITDTWDFSYGAEVNLNFDSGLSFSSDISQNSRRGYASADMNTNELIWNAQVSKSFFKGKALTVSLEWNDILGNRSNISRTIDSIRRGDSRTNAIYSYGMLHVIYRLSIFAGKNALGTDKEHAGFGGGGRGRGRW